VRKKDFIRIINEEISNFDFLSNEQHLREQEMFQMLENEAFQKQFIIDAITNFKEKIILEDNAGYITDDPNFDDAVYRDDEFIEYPARIIYEYNKEKEPIVFEVQFHGNKIDINEINVDMYSKDGDDIDFVAFKKAPKKIQELFVETFVKPIIENRGEIKSTIEKPQYASI